MTPADAPAPALAEATRTKLIAWLEKHELPVGTAIDREMTADALMADFLAPLLAEHVDPAAQAAEIAALSQALATETEARRVAEVRVEALTSAPKIEFHQHDWLPGFAAFAPRATTPTPDSRAFCILNLGSILACVQDLNLPKADLPYVIAESMMHEVIHVLEQWAGAEFSEERIDALLERYAEAARAALSDKGDADAGR